MSRIILSYLSQISRILLLFFLSLVLSREYGAVDKGKFDYTLIVFNILLNFGHISLNNASLFFYNKYKENYYKILKTNFTVIIILYLIYFGVFSNTFVSEKLAIQFPLNIIFAGIIYAGSITLANDVKNLFVSIDKINTVNFIELSSSLVNSLAIVLALYKNLNIEDFIVLYLMSYLLKIVISLVILFKFNKIKNNSTNYNQKSTFDITILKEQTTFAFALYLSQFFVFMNYRIDQIFIKEISGYGDLGIYSLAVSLSELIFIVHLGIVNILNSQMLNSENLSLKITGYKKYLKFSGLLLLILLPIAIVMSKIIPSVFGEEFVSAIPVFIVLIIANTIASFAKVSFSFLYSENKSKFHLYVTFLTVIVNVLFNLILIGPFGMMGAAYASLLSYIVYSGCYLIYMKKHYL